MKEKLSQFLYLKKDDSGVHWKMAGWPLFICILLLVVLVAWALHCFKEAHWGSFVVLAMSAAVSTLNRNNRK